MSEKPTVLLYGLHSVGLIIPTASGIIFQNQTGGYACLQDRMEGVFVPLDCEPINHYEALNQFFYKGKWKGHCSRGFDIETVEFIESTLARIPPHSGIKVDRNRLADSHEAWVHVALEDPTSTGLVGGVQCDARDSHLAEQRLIGLINPTMGELKALVFADRPIS